MASDLETNDHNTVRVREAVSTPRDRFVGEIDFVSDEKIAGWIRSVDSDEPLFIDVFINDQAFGCYIEANIAREALRDGANGSVRHGFEVDVSDYVLPPTDRGWSVEIALSETKEVVLTQFFQFARSADDITLIGSIDSCAGDELIGWVKADGREERVAIDVYCNGVRIVEEHVCEIHREDLEEAGFGDGAYGFRIDTSEIEYGSDDDELKLDITLAGDATVQLSRIFAPDYRFYIEGVKNGGLAGWYVDATRPYRVFSAEVLIDDLPYSTITNENPRPDLQKKKLSRGLGGFSSAVPADLLGPGSHRLSIRFPGGKVLGTTIENPVAGKGAPYVSEKAWSVGISVIVPVYNAVDDLKICIERLRKYTSDQVDILFIDDASPDPRISEVLSAIDGAANMRVLRNPKNLGFSGTINHGLANTGRNDVILLNSDARVTPGWVDGLRMAVYSGPRIATATPMSDRAGAFSAPFAGNENVLPDGVDEITYARSVRRNSLCLYPTVPTGNGFCMYVRRDCLDEVGVFDAEAFPRGYGEENDFCMRALRRGWRHVLDDSTYVFHERSKSFGSSKTGLMDAGRAIVDARYPEYQAAIGVFGSSPQIKLARFRALGAQQENALVSGGATRILFVIATQTGGTPQTNRDLMQALASDIEGWSLRCDSKMLELCRLVDGKDVVVRQHFLTEPVNPITHRSEEYDAVMARWLLAYDFDVVHIRHLGWHSLSLPTIAKKLMRKVIFSAHDFYMASPTVKLLDDDQVYLGTHFYEEGRKDRQGLWPVNSQPDPTGDWLKFWQERNVAVLNQCDALVTTSDSARKTILDHLPGLEADKFVVIPHGRDFSEFRRLRTPYLRFGERIRILVPGNIDIAKGLKVLKDLVAHDAAGILEFHILGDIVPQDGERHPRIILHGKYERNDFGNRVALIKPHLGAVFSIWDETWCHTLTEMWSVGVPVVAFDMPTVAGRIQQSGAGWVLNHTDIPALYEDLMRIATDIDEQCEKDTAVALWQAGEGAVETTRFMAANYLNLYRDLLRDRPSLDGGGRAIRVAVVCPAEPNLILANASTYIRVWERTTNRIDSDITYIRMTPEALVAALKLDKINAAIIQRTALPKTIAAKAVNLLRQRGVPFVFEMDDNLLDVPDQKDPSGEYRAYAPLIRQLIEESAVTTVTTSALKAELKPIAKRIEILPNRLSDRIWKPAPKPRIVDTNIRALYMGTVTHEEDLRMILSALDTVSAEFDNFRLSLVGVTESSDLFEGRESWLERISVPSSARAYADFVKWLKTLSVNYDFAIAPLTDSPFNLSKSPLKILDYAALGLPVLASDHPVYRELAEDGLGARLVQNTEEDWCDKLRLMISHGTRDEERTRLQLDWVAKNGFLSGEEFGFDQVIASLFKP